MSIKQGQSVWTSVGIGASVGAGGSVVATLALSALAASLISRETISETSMDMVALAILILSSAVGALTAVKVTAHHRLPVCMASGCIYYLVLLSCTALFFGGVYSAVGVTGLAIFGGCGAVVLLGLKEGRRGGARRYLKK